MSKFEDLSGQRFGMLIVLDKHYRDMQYNKTRWLCRCDCGMEKYILADSLKRGYVKSCGNHFQEFGKERQIHGDSHNGERLYSIWKNMKSRCKSSKGNNYKCYTSKGINVCEEWEKSYIAFKEWALANGYNDILTIDRIDGTKGYYPENCRWVTHKEQSNNISTNHLLTYNGKTQTLTQWAEEIGIKPSCLDSRLRQLHWPIEKALTTPPRQ